MKKYIINRERIINVKCMVVCYEYLFLKRNNESEALFRCVEFLLHFMMNNEFS